MEGASSSIIMLVVLIAVFYFMLIRPENKRKKKAQEMRDSLKKGDTITTIGGIVGKIVMVKPDTIVIETSDDRVRMEPDQVGRLHHRRPVLRRGEVLQGGEERGRGQEDRGDPRGSRRGDRCIL